MRGSSRQEVVLEGPIVAAAGHPDVAAPQAIAQRGEHGGLVKAPIRCAAREDQLAPFRRQEGCRRALGQGARAVAVDHLQELDGGQHAIPWRARLELERREEAWAESAQDRITFGGGHEDILVRDIGDRPDDGQSLVEPLHADLAIDDGDAVFSRGFGLLESRDGAAEQDQRLGHVALGGLKASLIPVLRSAEQRARVFLEHGERRIRESGFQVGDLSDEDGCPSRRLEIGDVLHGHDGPLVDQSAEAGGMNSGRALGPNPETAHVFEPVEQRDDIGGRRQFRIIPQPGETRAAHFWIDPQQSRERIPGGVGQTIRQGLESLLAGARPSRQPYPFQYSRRGDEHIGAAQMVEHCLDDRFAAISGPRGIGAHPQAGTPIRQPETPKAQMFLQFDRMLPAGLIPERVGGERSRRYAELVSYEGDHRIRRMFARPQALAGMPEEAQLDGEPEPVDGAPLRPDERQIIGAEHEVPRHSGRIDRDGE